MKSSVVVALVLAMVWSPGRAHAADSDELVRQGLELRRHHRDAASSNVAFAVQSSPLGLSCSLVF